MKTNSKCYTCDSDPCVCGSSYESDDRKLREKIFDDNAKKMMSSWGYAGFKRSFPTLHRVIMKSMLDYGREKNFKD